MSFEGGKTNFHARNADGEIETQLIVGQVSVCPECYDYLHLTQDLNTAAQQKQEEKQEIETVNMSEASVKVLLEKLKRNKAAKDQAVGGLVQNLMDTQEELRQKAAPFDHEAEKLEAEIKELMPAIAHTIKTENGAASYRKGSVRVTYSAKELDAIPNKAVWEYIQPYRKESTVAASTNIEIY